MINKNNNFKKDFDNYTRKSKIVGYILLFSLFSSVTSLGIWILSSIWFSSKINLAFVRLIATTLSTIKVEPAVISGINYEDIKYFITSKTLKNYINSYLQNQNIEFDNPFILLDTANGNKIQINANKGVIEKNTNILKLNSNIIITSTSGYQIYAESVFFDAKNSILYSTTRVQGNYNKSSFTANGFKIEDNLNKITINGPITIESE